ncbi:MAG: HU family DNA-binding protein [Muribaculaceae bacterium]|nr:HU family DNA-binding protein [Muribaculaceae bacterium]
MNEKITFPRLAALLADRSGRSKRFSEDFLREFFALISERLEAGDSVKVKGLGTFRLSRVEARKSVDVTTGLPMEISGHSKVVFIPSKELADAVNSPFEAFTAIEISDDADISQLFSKDEINLEENEDSDEDIVEAPKEMEAREALVGAVEDVYGHDTSHSESEQGIHTEQFAQEIKPDDMPLKESKSQESEDFRSDETAIPPLEKSDESIEGEDDAHYVEKENDAVEAKKDVAEGNEVIQESSEIAGPIDIDDEESELETDEDEVHSRRKNWIRTLMISLGAAIVALFATFAVWYLFATNDFNRIFNRRAANTPQQTTEGFVVGRNVSTEEPTPSPALIEDSVSDTLSPIEESEVPTAPSDAVVYDTISTTRYLTTMAKTHYGNFNLWPYIYEENKAILGHPDRIRPGTPVVIPKLSKYGVDPKNKDDIEKAKKMGVEIYARYGKKI